MAFFMCKARHDNHYLYYPLTVISHNEDTAKIAFGKFLEADNGEIIDIRELPDSAIPSYNHSLGQDLVQHNIHIQWNFPDR